MLGAKDRDLLTLGKGEIPPESGANEIGGIPPPSRNHRLPTAGDTPAAAAASSLGRPAATARQNRCRSSRLATDGRPGDHICPRISRTAC